MTDINAIILVFFFFNNVMAYMALGLQSLDSFHLSHRGKRLHGKKLAGL